MNTVDLLGLSALSIAGGVVVLLLARGRWLRARTLRTVVIHLTDGTSIRGVLADSGRHGLVLTFARYLDAEAEVPLVGETLIPRERVLVIQVEPAHV